ncbi:MAG: uroporphyrinogen-III synthase [Neisseria sp.]|nr:uroporphyrinogen-III synthase [Neisseria sp.]
MPPVLLIVRPPGQAAADLAACARAGWRGEVFPPFTLEPDPAALAQLPRLFRAASAVFWASPGAVQIAAPLLDFSDGGKIQLAVGQGGRKALQPFCPFPVDAPEDGCDSEAVLRLPLWRRLRAGAEVLIIRGRGGREFLARRLAEAGFTVRIAEIYSRRPEKADWARFAALSPAAARVASGEAARWLFTQSVPPFTQTLQSLLYFTHHPRIAETLYAAGARRVVVSGGPDTEILHRYTEQTR